MTAIDDPLQARLVFIRRELSRLAHSRLGCLPTDAEDAEYYSLCREERALIVKLAGGLRS